MARGRNPDGSTVTRLAVIPGDGIGPEVVRSGVAVMQAAASNDASLELEFEEFPWGSE